MFLVSSYEDFTNSNIFYNGKTIIAELKVLVFSFTCTVIINDVILNGLCLHFIIWKFYQIMYYLDRELIRIQSRNNINANKLKVNKDKQNQIADLVTKLSLLTIICLIFSQLYNICCIVTSKCS